MIIAESRFNNARKHYNTALDNYTRSKTNFVNFHHALRELKEADVAFSEIKFFHLREKILLARYSGMENFPGERHEELAEKMANVEDIEDQNDPVQSDGDIPASAGSDGAEPIVKEAPAPSEEAPAPSEEAPAPSEEATAPSQEATDTTNSAVESTDTTPTENPTSVESTEIPDAPASESEATPGASTESTQETP
jgi:hypothetical protein